MEYDMNRIIRHFASVMVAMALPLVISSCTKEQHITDREQGQEAEMSLNALSQGMSGSTTKGSGPRTKGWVTETGGAEAFVDIANPADASGTTTPRTIMLGVWNATEKNDYFTGVPFSKDDTDSKWHANPRKYYPLRCTVDLLAYSSGNAIIADWESAHKVSLQVTDTQDDILYSSTRASSMDPEADMTFHHSQAWITFEISSTNNTAFHVDSLYWEDVYRNGVLNLEYNEAEGQWENPTATWNFFTQETGNVGVDDPFGALFTTATPRTAVPVSIDPDAPTRLNMLLPEQPHSSFVVLYTISGHQFAKRISGLSENWERSRHYIYTLKFNVTNISMAPSVELWVEETIDRINSVDVVTGVFSVSADKKVAISKGNLQYRPSDDKWRFAEHQWEYVGGDVTTGGVTTHFGNVKNSTNNPMVTAADGTKRDMTDAERAAYDGWFDLFGWGTSGVDPGSDRHYQPWETVNGNYGPTTDLTADNDWGINIRVFEYFRPSEIISEFRTLSSAELTYLFDTRTTKSTHRWFTGTLKWGLAAGESTKGVFILPDNFLWHESYGPEPSAYEDDTLADYTVDNTVGARFSKMESAGVVFIPYAGKRELTAVSELGEKMNLWTATVSYSNDILYKTIPKPALLSPVAYQASLGFSVRLATDLDPSELNEYVTSSPTIEDLNEYPDVI